MNRFVLATVLAMAGLATAASAAVTEEDLANDQQSADRKSVV